MNSITILRMRGEVRKQTKLDFLSTVQKYAYLKLLKGALLFLV